MTSLSPSPLGVDDVAGDAVAWRRHLHAHPELSFQEHETAAFVRERLAEIGGYELSSPTPTSVVARLRFDRPGRTLALRADMDALPIEEESGVEFASTRPGVMHACGHDAHTAQLLAVARLLAARREALAGEVRLLFQHAEELPPGGAQELVAAGALEGVDAVVGCHVISDLEVGRVSAVDGPCSAAADVFTARIRGKGGHAAFPEDSIDPIAAAAQAIAGLQQIVSREVAPRDRAVVSVTRVHGGTADNVIPEVVELGGTVRTYDEEVRRRIVASLRRILDGVAAAHRCTAELDYVDGYRPTVNDAALAGLVRSLAGDRLAHYPPMMGGEDFSAYGAAAPACFFFVGAGGPGAFPHHHPRFAIDEAALPVAIETFVSVAERFLR
ncbi:MAG TPA: amidohydrolase [Gaiellaceae bacterium]|nr:amidohydrolase [Gaiellaceae bacterium]